MFRIAFFLVITIVVITATSCQHKQAEPQPTGTVTFSKDINPLLTQNCSPCHQGEDLPDDGHLSDGPIPFVDNYDKAKQLIGDMITRVELPENSFRFMPRGGHKLSDAEIQALKKWMDEGMPQ